MRISEVKWSNYRRMPDAAISVASHLVLAGPNDAGKSSVLRAIDMCIGMPRAQLASAITVRDFTDQTQPITLSVTLAEATDDELAAFPDEADVLNGNQVTLMVEATLGAETGGADSYASAESVEIKRFFVGAGHDRGPSREQLDLIGWALLPASRSLLRELDGAGGTVRQLLARLDLGADTSAITQRVVDLKASIESADAVKALTDNLETALNSALPQQLPPGSIRLASGIDLGESAVSDMTVTIHDGSSVARLADQSDGIRSMSLLALSGISHRTARILAIDEPETHLHATAQRSIARTLQQGERQSVMATHSVSVIRATHPANVVAFGPGRAARQLDAHSKMRSATTAAKYWTPGLVEALTARKVLFVEGQSDQIVCETLVDLLDLRFDQHAVSIVELGGGASFPYAYALLGPLGFGLPCMGLLDEDKRGKWAEGVGVEEADLEAHGYLVCNPDLEAMYIEALGVPRVVDMLLAVPELTRVGLLKVAGVSDLDDVTENGLADYCRKYKVTAAVALAQSMTVEDAGRMTALADHLRAVVQP